LLRELIYVFGLSQAPSKNAFGARQADHLSLNEWPLWRCKGAGLQTEKHRQQTG
jgi:hypothetical protein